MPRLAGSVLTVLLVTQILLPLSAGRTEVGSDSKEAAKRDSLPVTLDGVQATVPAPADPDTATELEDRLVILPEIKREGERFFLSSFKLPEKLMFAGQPVPL
ncbi:MAG: hypothetical protein ACREIM_05995, partial [Nitrospiraceae bacterium]